MSQNISNPSSRIDTGHLILGYLNRVLMSISCRTLSISHCAIVISDAFAAAFANQCYNASKSIDLLCFKLAVNMATFVSFVEKQQDLFVRITRILNNVKKLGKDHINRHIIDIKIASMDSHWEKFQSNHESSSLLATRKQRVITMLKIISTPTVRRYT